MSGYIVSIPEQKHVCAGLPALNLGYPRGTIWKCDDCPQHWVLVMGSQYNESYSAWRKLTEANKGGFDK